MKGVLIVLGVVAAPYVALCAGLYFKQESLLFLPSRLRADHQFAFPGAFEERWTTVADGTRLHGLLFCSPNPILLHGNGGVNNWGETAPTYARLGYDVFFLDYRSYGKSQGRISRQAQLLSDVQTAYRQLLAHYPENQIVILGYSVGTGPATWLAAQQHPKLLILQAPYFSMRDLATHLYPFVPGFLVRYPLPTNQFITQVQAPIVLVHGDQDEVSYYQSSLRLRLLKPTDRLVLLSGAGHKGLTDNPLYQRELAKLLWPLSQAAQE